MRWNLDGGRCASIVVHPTLLWSWLNFEQRSWILAASSMPGYEKPGPCPPDDSHSFVGHTRPHQTQSFRTVRNATVRMPDSTTPHLTADRRAPSDKPFATSSATPLSLHEHGPRRNCSFPKCTHIPDRPRSTTDVSKGAKVEGSFGISEWHG